MFMILFGKDVSKCTEFYVKNLKFYVVFRRNTVSAGTMYKKIISDRTTSVWSADGHVTFNLEEE